MGSKIIKSVFGILLIWSLTTVSIIHAQQDERPKIGLTLSGGGAKGLAHIGVLKAIDDAGLQIDYISGTSMGAIIGSLYAVGYTGEQIDSLAQTFDWELVLSNDFSFPVLFMEEKEQYKRFPVELPLVHGRIQPEIGIIRGQELDLKLSELFAPFYKINHFKDLQIPFQCVATDLRTGELVVLDSGDLAKSVRASMAIPTVFTDVRIDGRRLVDGGLVRNYPVSNVINMGADYVIGSDVSLGLAQADKLRNPVDVIMQIAFYRSNIGLESEISLTDSYIHTSFQKHGMASFSNSHEIMKIGDQTGARYFSHFVNLADSLNHIYGVQVPKKTKNISQTSFFINKITVRGLEKTTASFFRHIMEFELNKEYTAPQISKAIRRAYGSMYYNSITYELLENAGGTEIIFNVEENKRTYLKLGLFYDELRGINIHANITSRDLLIRNSRSMVSASIGESMQFKAQHFQYLGRSKSFAIVPSFGLDRLHLIFYDRNYDQDGAYRQVYYRSALDIQTSAHKELTLGLGTASQQIRFKPVVRVKEETEGSFTNYNSYFFVKKNTMNKPFYPTEGIRVHAELGFIYNQKPNITILEDGNPIGNLDRDFGNFVRLHIDGTAHAPLWEKFNVFSEFQLGINFTRKLNTPNSFFVGGINGNFRNQIRFAGLNEASIVTPSTAVLQLGLQYRVFNNMYFIGRANGLFKDFIPVREDPAKAGFISGYSLTFAYNSPIGPFELSAMYSPESNKLLPYVRFGIAL